MPHIGRSESNSGDSRDSYLFRGDYVFKEVEACEEWDYFAEREARAKLMSSSEEMVVSRPSHSLHIRLKGLPQNFRTENTVDFLQQVVAKNVSTTAEHAISKLRCIQKYMIPLVLNEFSFLAMGPTGCGKTTGYLLPLINKLVELKEVELRGRQGPIALIVTYSGNMLRHVKDLYSKYARGTGIVTYFAMSKKREDEKFYDFLKNLDMFCASSKTLIDTFTQFQISLEFVKFLVIEEYECCKGRSDYKENLTVLKDRLSKDGIFPSCIFLSTISSDKCMIDIGCMKEMAQSKVAKLVVPPIFSSFEDLSVSVLPCHSVMDHCRWIVRIIGGNGVTPTKTVVLVSAPQRAHYLALLLKYLNVNTIYITRDDNLLDVEEASRLWYTGKCDVLVADYDSLKDLDYGFVETCIVFELPDDCFSNFETRLLDLSVQVKHRRLYIMLNVDLDREQANTILKFLESLNQDIPYFLLELSTLDEPSTEDVGISYTG